MDIRGRTAFVTGTGQGIGRLLAERLAAAGCDVIGCDLDEGRQAETRAAVEAAGARYTALSCDLADTDAARVMTRAAAKIGFDVLVLNAGIATSGRYLGDTFETWERTVMIDLMAVMAMTYEALGPLTEKPAGHVVFMSSIAGVAAAAGTAAYNAAKFGVTGFGRAIQMEYEGSRVGVSIVHPTMTRTRMIDGVRGSRSVPVIEPEQVADAVMASIAAGGGTVFVPRRMRWVMDVFPRLMPGTAGRLAQRDDSAKSWLAAQKGLPD